MSSGGFWPGESPASEEEEDTQEPLGAGTPGRTPPEPESTEPEPEPRPPFSQEAEEPGAEREPEPPAMAEPEAEPVPPTFEPPLTSEHDSGPTVMSEPESPPQPPVMSQPEPPAMQEPEPEPEPEPPLMSQPEPEPEPPLMSEPESPLTSEPDSEAQTPVAAPEPELQLQPMLPPVMHAPGELDVPEEIALLEGSPSGADRTVGIVVARFNGEVSNRLLTSALEALEAAGVSQESITVMPVPGAFELPIGAMALAKTRRYSCVIALGCVIRGKTAHFEYIASEAASGLQLAGLETGVPVAFGVLTVDRVEQAEERTDKGADAARAALEMADLFAQLRSQARG